MGKDSQDTEVCFNADRNVMLLEGPSVLNGTRCLKFHRTPLHFEELGSPT